MNQRKRQHEDEQLISVNEIHDFGIKNMPELHGTNGVRLGMLGMLGILCGGSKYDGYEIKTSAFTYRILISNGQNCCEDWGYFSSDDNFSDYIGKTLVDVTITDTALNTAKLEEACGRYGFDRGGIQFVDFKFSDGSVLQFAVYNGHNGYYGHAIVIAKDRKILLEDTI